MSNPGYPYQQGAPSYNPSCPQTTASPYPTNNPPYPTNNSPYPTNNPPYPTNSSPYPPQNGVFAPSAGFGVGSPMYMPQPYPGAGYPSSTGGASYQPYPSYPQQAPQYQNYPPNSTYPPQTQAPSQYPQGQSSNSSTYPPQSQASSPYPQGQQGYPSNTTNQNRVVVVKKTPTVVPATNFNPREDAEALRKAMKGMGCDKKTVINIVTKRSNAQRLEIVTQFKTLYGKDLIKELKSELSGNLEDTVIALMTPLPQFYAKELHDALFGMGTDETVLIEVLCTLTNSEIRTIREAYQKTYHKNLESDLKGDTSGHFRRLMVSLCTAGRDESMVTNPQTAAADAQALYNAGEKIWGTDESTFNMILCQRNQEQLKLIFQEYQKITGHDIEKAVKSEFSGDVEDGLLAVIRSVKNQPAFFAQSLYKSMKGLGTNDRDLIRLVVSRCEVDMGEIKKAYPLNHKESLADAIKGDTSGDYRKCLLSLIGEA